MQSKFEMSFLELCTYSLKVKAGFTDIAKSLPEVTEENRTFLLP
jgi:hypothetical protein